MTACFPRRRPRCSTRAARSAGPRSAPREETPFDLASLTKILCTATAFVGLWAEGKVGPSTPVSRWIDGSPLAKNGATLGDLLAHRSGLPAWQPVLRGGAAHRARAAPRRLPRRRPGSSVRSEVRDAAARSPLDAPPGTRTLYSDIGFLLAGEMLAEAAGAPLDAVHARMSGKLGVAHPLPPALHPWTRRPGPLRWTMGRTAAHRLAAARGRRRRARRTAGSRSPASRLAPARWTTTTPG